MKIKPLILLPALLMLAGRLTGQTNSDLIAIDPAAGDQRIDGLEAFPAGLCWWKRGAAGGGEFGGGYSASLGVQMGLSSYLTSLTRGGPRYYVPPSQFIGGAARDGAWIYFTAMIGQEAGLWRKPQSATQNSVPELITPVFSQLFQSPGAVQRRDGSIYIAPGSTNGHVAVWKTSFAANGDYDGQTVVAEGSLTPGSPVKKLAFYRFLGGEWGLALQANGNLWKFGPLSTPGTHPFTLLATAVGDVAVRREGGIGPGNDPAADVIYGTTVPSVRPGRLFTVSHLDGRIFNQYVDPQSQGTLSLGADGNYLFISRSPALDDLSGGELLRKYRPANSANYNPALETNNLPGQYQGWVSLESIPGVNLQTDGRWLYFTRGNQVRRVSTIAPPPLDIHAFGIEAVQIVQSFNNSVRLIAGKPLTVRGYARLAGNDAGFATVQPGAVLEVYRNGAKIGQYYPSESCTVDNRPAAGEALGERRSKAAQSFMFDIPSGVMQRGRMRFQMTVNPARTIVETTGVNPYANNTVSTPEMDVIQMGVPNLFCMTMDVADCDDYTLKTEPEKFWAQIARAKSLLPVADIRVHSYPLVISKPVVRFGIPAVVMRSFDMREDEDLALFWLRTAVTLTNDPFRDGDNHYLGMVHPGIPPNAEGKTFSGIGSNPPPPGGFLVVRMEGSEGTKDWNEPLGGRTLAHELAHNYDLDHIDQTKAGCGGTRPDGANDSYPYNKCMIGPEPNTIPQALFGFDPISRSVIDGTRTADLMSYHTTRWLSDDSFNVLLGRIPGFAAPALMARRVRGPAGGDVVFISGTVDAVRGQAEFWPCQSVGEGIYDPARINASLDAAAQGQPHGYEVQQVDANGNTLASSPLLLAATGDGTSNRLGFAQFVRKESAVSSLVLTLGGATLARMNVSSSAPQINAEAPVYDPATHSLRWVWSATDADNDSLFFTVQTSPDDGQSWQTVQPATPQQSVVIDTRALPGASQGRLRVVATDGFHTAIAVSGPFTLPEQEPVVTITGVTDGEALAWADNRTISAFSMDLEDGSLPPAGTTWTLTGPEVRTLTGESLSLAGLAPGAYTVIAAAADSSGNEGSSTMHFSIRPASIPISSIPVVDGELNEEAWSSALYITCPVFAAAPVAARLVRSNGRIYLGLSDLPFRGPDVTLPFIGTVHAGPASIGIYVDANASGGSGAQPGDLALVLNEEGLLTQYRGNGSTMVNGAPNGGIESAVAPGIGGWTAELGLPAGMLGGDDNALRLMFLVDVPYPMMPPVRSSWPPAANPDVPDTWVAAQTGEVPPLPNQPPVATVGPDRLIDPAEPVAVVLDGLASRDPEGQPLTFHWTQTAGPPVALTNTATAQPSFETEAVAVQTSWSFQLVVNDGELDSAPATVTITAFPVVTSPAVPGPDIVLAPDGSVTGRLSPDLPETGIATASGGLWMVEKSFDLQNWMPFGTAAPDLLGRLEFTDSDGGGPRGYYRAVRADTEGTLNPGFALSGDGGVRWVTVPHDDAFNSLPFTASAWIKTSSNLDDTAGIVSKYNDASFDGWSMFVRNGHIHGWYLSGSHRVYEPPLGLDGGFVADGNWHHVALVVNAEGGDLYVDGVSRTHLDWTGIPTAPSTEEPVLIGRYDTYELGFSGEIDEVSIWSEALGPLQVLDLIRRAPAGTETGLTALWSCDDGAGSTLTDLTSAGRHGTLMGEPAWITSTAPIRR